MNGFGFIEYEDATDARDVVPRKCFLTPSHNIQNILILTDYRKISAVSHFSYFCAI